MSENPEDNPANQQPKKEGETKGRKKRTLEQKIAEHQDKLANLRRRQREKETSEKIITGAVVINTAMKEPPVRDWLLEQLKSQTSNRDKDRISGLVERLQNIEFPKKRSAANRGNMELKRLGKRVHTPLTSLHGAHPPFVPDYRPARD